MCCPDADLDLRKVAAPKVRKKKMPNGDPEHGRAELIAQLETGDPARTCEVAPQAALRAAASVEK